MSKMELVYLALLCIQMYRPEKKKFVMKTDANDDIEIRRNDQTN